MADTYSPSDEPPVNHVARPDVYSPSEEGENRRLAPDPGDMTPGKPILSTSFRSVPSRESPAADGWFTGVPTDPVATRIRGAVTDAWQNANIITPEYQEKMNAAPEPSGWINRNIVNPSLHAIAAAPAAVGAGTAATIGELATAAGQPALGRDLNMAMQVLPISAAESAPLRSTRMAPRVEEPGPRLAPADTKIAPEARTVTAQGPVSPVENVPPRMDLPPGYQPPPPTPLQTANQAFDNAGKLYKIADDKGGTILPNANNRFLDTKIAELNKQTPQERIFAGDNAVTKTAADFNAALRDQPLSLESTQGIDRNIGDRIGVALRAGEDGVAAQLVKMRNALRDHVENAVEADTAGGTEGFKAVSDARKGWSVAVRMQELEQMRERALGTANVQTSVKNQVNSMTSNPDRLRGWTDGEIAALKAAGKTGNLDEVYRTLGSRLVPIGASVTGGIAGGIAAGGAQAVISNLFRSALTDRSISKLNDAIGVLGLRAPRPPGPGSVPGPSLIPRRAPVMPTPGYASLIGARLANGPPSANPSPPAPDLLNAIAQLTGQ
jgi:hypothetical protein